MFIHLFGFFFFFSISYDGDKIVPAEENENLQLPFPCLTAVSWAK